MGVRRCQRGIKYGNVERIAIAAIKRFDAGRRGEVDLQPGEWRLMMVGARLLPDMDTSRPMYVIGRKCTLSQLRKQMVVGGLIFQSESGIIPLS